jgi:hypothetical protein
VVAATVDRAPISEQFESWAMHGPTLLTFSVRPALLQVVAFSPRPFARVHLPAGGGGLPCELELSAGPLRFAPHTNASSPVFFLRELAGDATVHVVRRAAVTLDLTLLRFSLPRSAVRPLIGDSQLCCCFVVFVPLADVLCPIFRVLP